MSTDGCDNDRDMSPGVGNEGGNPANVLGGNSRGRHRSHIFGVGVWVQEPRDTGGSSGSGSGGSGSKR